jgi:hypothetical protein
MDTPRKSKRPASSAGKRPQAFARTGLTLGLAAAFLLALNGCGGASYRQADGQQQGGGDNGGGNDGGGNWWDQPNDDPDTNWEPSSPPIELGFTLSSDTTAKYTYRTTGVALQTDNLLKVQVTALPPEANSNGTPYTPPVNCQAYKITLKRAGNNTVVSSKGTRKLLVPGGDPTAVGCEGAVEAHAIDFSTLTGAGIAYQIEVSDPVYQNQAICSQWISGRQNCTLAYPYWPESYWDYLGCGQFKSANRDAFCFKPVVSPHVLSGGLNIEIN